MSNLSAMLAMNQFGAGDTVNYHTTFVCITIHWLALCI